MFTFKTFVKLAVAAVGTVAAVAIADKVVEAIYENRTVDETTSDSAKIEENAEIIESKRIIKVIVNAFIALNVMSTIAIKFYARGLQTGVIYGAVSAAKNDATMEDVRNVVLDDAAFGHLMGEIGEAVRV